MTPTATKRPSQELAKLEAERDRTYSALQEVKHKRALYDDETQRMRAELSAKTMTLGPGGRLQPIPSPGPEVAKLEAEVKKRLTEPNPNQQQFETRRAAFHAADEAVERFLVERLDDLIAEQVGDADVASQLADALDRLIEIGNSYAAITETVKLLIGRVPGHDHRSADCDPRPAEWAAWARAARDSLDHPIAAPGVSQWGVYRKAVLNHG